MAPGGLSRIQQPHPVQATVSSVLHHDDNFVASNVPPPKNLSIVEPRLSDADAAGKAAEATAASDAKGPLNGNHGGPSHGTNGAPNSHLTAPHLSSNLHAHPSPSLTPGFPPYGYFDAISSLGLHAPSPMLMMPFTPTPGPANSPFLVPTPAPYYDSGLLNTPAGAAGTSAPESSPMPLPHAHHAQYRHMFHHQGPGGPPPLDAFQLPPTAMPSDYPPDGHRGGVRYPHPNWRVNAAPSPALPPPALGLLNSDPHMHQLHSSFSQMSLSNYPSSPQIQPQQHRRQPLNGAGPSVANGTAAAVNGDLTSSPLRGAALGSPEQVHTSPAVNGMAPPPGGDTDWVPNNRRDDDYKAQYGRHHQQPNDYVGMRAPQYMYQQPRGAHHMPMGRIPPSHGGGSLGGRPPMNGAGMHPHMNGMGGPGGRRVSHGGPGYSPPRGGPNGAHPGPDYGPPHHHANGAPGGPPSGSDCQIDDLSAIAPEQVAKYATTQYGSRALQDYVMTSDENFRMVFDAIFEPFSRLMVDLFGNYLCQKVLQKCNSERLSSILKRLKTEIPGVSCDRQGTRVMQRIIQHAEEDAQIDMIIDAIRDQDQVRSLMLDSHGCYVINAMIEFMPIQKVVFVFDVAVEHCEFLASDQHGLCVLKKCLQRTAEKPTQPKNNANARPNDFAPPDRKPRQSTNEDRECMRAQYERLASKVLEHALDFVDNQFGNYLVQCLLDLATEKVRDDMHSIFRTRYCEFSMKKFSSNVVERFLKSGSDKIRQEIVDELIRSSNFSTLLQDSFGNYVIQNSLVTAPANQAQQLMAIIQPLLSTLRRNVRRKWERLIKSVKARQEKSERERAATQARARALNVTAAPHATAESNMAPASAPQVQLSPLSVQQPGASGGSHVESQSGVGAITQQVLAAAPASTKGPQPVALVAPAAPSAAPKTAATTVAEASQVGEPSQVPIAPAE